MPDLLSVFSRKWKFIVFFTIIATIVALIFALISPKEYLSTATALPANSMVADKARIFNPNIEILYSDFGTPDELDRMEGTGMLDTIYIATASDHSLAGHYGMEPSGEGPFKAAMRLKENSRINRSGYGELKVKVWDRDRNMAAALSNSLLQKIKDLHQHLQNESNENLLKLVKQDQMKTQDLYRKVSDSISNASGADAEILGSRKTSLLEQLQQHEKLINQYEFALLANPPVLLTVENARPPLWADKPRTLPIVLFTAFGALVFSFLLSVFMLSRKP